MEASNQELHLLLKEQGCILQLSRLGQKTELSLDEFIIKSLPVIRASFLNPEDTCIQVKYLNRVYESPGYKVTSWKTSRGIMEKEKMLGTITACLTKASKKKGNDFFLPQEKKLLITVSNYILQVIRQKEFDEQLQGFKKVITLSSNIILIVNETGRAEYINDSFVNTLGFGLEELNQDVQVLIDLNASGDDAFIDIMTHLKNKGIWKGELKVRTKRKDILHVMGTISGTRNENGNIKYVAIFENITDEVRLRQENIEQLKKYETVLENIPVSIILTDYNGNLIFTNRQAALNFGLTKSDFEGKNLLDIFPVEGRTTIKAIQTVFRIKKSISLETIYTINNVKRYFDINRLPLFDADGNVSNVMSIAIETSDKKQAERLTQIQHAIDSLSSISDTVDETFKVLFDNLFRLDWVDAAGIYGFNEGNTELDIIYHRGLSDGFIAKTSTYGIDTPEVKMVNSGQVLFIGKDDFSVINHDLFFNEKISLVAVLPLIYKNEVIGALNLASKKYSDLDDYNRLAVESIAARVANLFALVRTNEQLKEKITELKEKQQILEQKSKLESLGELSAGLAHEINQPLSVISLAFENIQFKLSEDHPQSEYFKRKTGIINMNIEKIRELIDHIRVFSRDQSSVMFEKVDVNEAIQSTVSLIQLQLDKHKIRLSLDLCEQRCSTLGNMTKVELVMMNLVSNARDAVDEKGYAIPDKDFLKHIQITTKVEGNDIIITVEDNGTGIPAENLEKIYNPFFTTKPPGKGTGLGLSMVYGIITEMKGSIVIGSKVDQYTCVKIILPRV